MFLSPAAPAAPTSLRLAHAAHRVLDVRRPFSPHDHVYFTDLLATYGMRLDEGAFAAGRVSFTELVAGLIPDLGAYGDRFDLAVLASLTSDAEPGWPMSYLGLAVPEPGLAFAVTDQGVLAPFTALNLTLAWARRDGVARALVFVLDQSAVLHTRPIAPELRATENSGTVLVLDAGAGQPDVDHVEAPEPVPAAAGEVHGLWTALVRRLRPEAMVIGGMLADRLPGLSDTAGTVVAPRGRPCGGPWSVLAERLPTWHTDGLRVLLADYDPEAGRLAWCRFDLDRPGAVEGER